MYLGDNIVYGGIKSFVNEYGNNGEDISVLLSEVESPERFGIAVLDQHGKVKSLIEKPAHFISNKALVGVYIFNYRILMLGHIHPWVEMCRLLIVRLNRV